ncbi:cysteine--tRNA ligase [Candidatus Saccharibacteria bacterium]|nr:cysteine--tRNA ligase [Candidatus Saccharibacteria bacterium]
MIKLYNSLTNSKQEFKPISASRASIYSCGPTVYDRVHVGNLRAFLFPDLLQRVLRYLENIDVDWVMNITDIDDKMMDRFKADYPEETPANALGRLADKYTDLFLEDIEKIGIKRGDISHLPRATDYIPQIQSMILTLLKANIAYLSDGSIYFSIAKYEASGQKYGRLVSLNFTPQSRVTQDQDQKEGVADFALWKVRKTNEPYWDFEIEGQNLPGRPGWHIECSAMSREFFGGLFDIHTGGVDLKFPHHENELAQCGGAQANFYLHNEHLSIEQEKMSKSIGNTKFIDDINDPIAFRYLVLSGHYRSQMDFNLADLASAHERIKNLRTYSDQLMLARVGQLPAKDDTHTAEQCRKQFVAALEDDLNTPKALAAISLIEGKVFSEDAKDVIRLVDNIFGLNLVCDIPLHAEALELIDNYTQARKDKNFELSDQLRAELLADHRLVTADTALGALVSRA